MQKFNGDSTFFQTAKGRLQSGELRSGAHRPASFRRLCRHLLKIRSRVLAQRADEILRKLLTYVFIPADLAAPHSLALCCFSCFLRFGLGLLWKIIEKRGLWASDPNKFLNRFVLFLFFLMDVIVLRRFHLGDHYWYQWRDNLGDRCQYL